MNDAYGPSGYDETDHWTLFGDPSVSLRTSAPSNLSVTHSGSFDPSDGAYEVIVPSNFDNILAALSHNGTLLGSDYANNGVAVIIVNQDVSNYDNLTLTVTGYNTTTVIESVSVGQACPGYVSGDLNGDSTVNVIDVVEIVYIILDNEQLSAEQLWAVDMNYSSDINVIDITMLINFIFLP